MTISAEYRENLHKTIDREIDKLQGKCDVDIEYGTTVKRDSATGALRRVQNGVVIITIIPSQ